MRAYLLPTILLFLASAALADELSVPVTITEPAGVKREMFPASGGIPFKPGQVKDVADLALVDAKGLPVPAQFSKLAGYDDGSVQWALVDVVVPELPANGKVEYLIRKGAGAGDGPARGLKVSETDDKVTVDTGVVAFTISKANFSLFDEVTVGGVKAVTGSIVDLQNCELGERVLRPDYNRDTKLIAMKEGGKVFPCRTGKPARVKWEYRGPVRATLRVDGDYIGDGGAPLGYTTRITAWAGCPAVRVEHSIRNSNASEGNDAYIKQATITLKLAVPARPQVHEAPASIHLADPPPPPPPTTQPTKRKSPAGDYSAKPCDDWISGDDGQVGLVILTRHTGGVYRGPGTYLKKVIDCGWYTSWPGLFVQNISEGQAVIELVSAGPKLEGKGSEAGALGFTQDGTFALADRSHKDSEVWFDFYRGARAVGDNRDRAAGFRSKLLVLAPGSWYSETETLGSGHFGTLADEIAAYKAWGWAGWDDSKKYPKLPHQPFAFVPKEAIHDVSEDDAVEGYLLQFLRTGERGYFDWAEAYDGFFRCHAIFRNDWQFGAGDGKARQTVRVDEKGINPDTKKPPGDGERVARGMGFGWYGPNYYDWSDSRMHGCHQYGRGVFDYYCLTGNTDSLEAGLNAAEEFGGGYMRAKPGESFTLGRAFGRAFNTTLRAYQVTRDPKYKLIADRYAALLLKADNWQPQQKIYCQHVSSMGYPYFEWDWVKQRPNNNVYVVPPRLLKYIADNGLSVTMEREGAFAHKSDQKWEIFVLTQIFELSECHQAMERYARIMDSKEMKDRLVEFTRGIVQTYWSEKCQFMRDSGYVNWPDNGKTRDRWEFMDSHDNCPNDPCGIHSGYSSRYVADMCARAYSFSGDQFFLDWGKKCWDRGSKRAYQQPSQMAGANEAPPFANITGAHGDNVLECCARLFYETGRKR